MVGMDGDEGKDGKLPFTVRTVIGRVDRLEGRMTTVEHDVSALSPMVRTHDRMLIGFVDGNNELVNGVLQTINDLVRSVKESADEAKEVAKENKHRWRWPIVIFIGLQFMTAIAVWVVAQDHTGTAAENFGHFVHGLSGEAAPR